MPYQDKEKDRAWHREYMRRQRYMRNGLSGVTRYGVTNGLGSSVTPKIPQIDGDGNVIPSYD